MIKVLFVNFQSLSEFDFEGFMKILHEKKKKIKNK